MHYNLTLHLSQGASLQTIFLCFPKTHHLSSRRGDSWLLQPGGTSLPTHMVGWQADSISSGHTKNQGATLKADPGSRFLTGLSCQSNVVECQDDNA
jgi:hypothetical protein